MSTRYRLIESPKGNGKNFRDDQFLAEKWLFACDQAGAG